MPKGKGKGRKGKGPYQRPTTRHVLSKDQTDTARSNPVLVEDEAPGQSQPSQRIRPITASQKENILQYHTDMVTKLSGMFSLKSNAWSSICSRIVMLEYLSVDDMGEVKNMFDLCEALRKKGTIHHGEYSKLRAVLVVCDVDAGNIIDKYTKKIRRERRGQPQPKRQRTDEGVGHQHSTGQPRAKRQSTDEGVEQQHSSEFCPKIAAMIGRTKAMIEATKESPFIATKGFQDAKEKLQKNRVVVIKGNSGDGKTTTAIRLICGLIEEQHSRQPLELQNIHDLDSLPPQSKLITFIDGIFGESGVREKDVGDWNKRIKSVLPTLCGDPHTEANFLIITIRNEVFNSLRCHTLENVFDDSNIIDLSSNDYKIKGEMLEFLESYKPENVKFSWKEHEKDEIIKYATGIGFPQCCKLFRDIPKLQKERVEFFKNPFDFLERVLEELAECKAILFLFLNGGYIEAKDLDPNCDKVDKTLLGEAFDVNLKRDRKKRSALNYKQKIEFLRESLDNLSGFLVVKQKLWYRDGFVYRFAHDSIYSTVERLYRQITPIGFIRYCPTRSLSLFTISKSTPDRISLPPDNYVYMFERILREWDSDRYYSHGIVCFLDVWTDGHFIECFVRWLNDKNIDNVDVLNKACHCGVKHVVLYLLDRDVKPNKDTEWLSLIFRPLVDDVDMDTVQKVIIYMNDEMKLELLNKACSESFVGCALYLLSEGVKPDKDTDWWSLIGLPWGFDVDMDTLQKVIKYMNDDIKLELLNKACSKGVAKCALYLLSEGVKPNKDTDWWSLVKRDLGRDVGIRRKVDMDTLQELDMDTLQDVYMDTLQNVIKYMNDEEKLDLLNKACCSSSDECVKYLLSEAVECEENTPFCVVKTGNIDMLRNIVSDINDETKLSLLNVTCYTGLEECALYLLSKGGKPDNNTPFCVVRGGSVNVFRELVNYDVIPTVRSKRSKSSNKYVSLCHVSNINVLHEACLFERVEMVTLLCNAYPELVHDTDEFGHTPLLLAALTGNCGIFHTVERFILKTLYRVEDEQHKCESVNGRVVHRNCVCAQYMSQVFYLCRGTILNMICEQGHIELCVYMCQSYPELATVENKFGITVLHSNCLGKNWEICKYLCQLYPVLTAVVDSCGRHFLHYMARFISDVSLFSEYEIVVKQYLESIGQMYDITTILDNNGRSVLHESCERGNRDICVYLCQTYPNLATAVDKVGRTVLHESCERGNRDICVYLCQTYPKLTTAVDKVGRTALRLSCERGDREICKYLCETFPELTTAVDKDGRTVLHVSCERGDREICKYLCQTFPELTTDVDKDGGHCLHYLAKCNRVDVDMFTECQVYVKRYLESLGKKYDIKTILNNRGQSVLDVAKDGWRINRHLYRYLLQLFNDEVQVCDKVEEG